MDQWQEVDILLAEDSEVDAKMTLRAFGKICPSSKLFRVCDGMEAIEFIFRQGKYRQRDDAIPKLIMLDVSMPKVNGMDVLQRLKSSESTKAIPVIMLTASAQQKDIMESYGLGGNGYLLKPIEIAALTDLLGQAGLSNIVLKGQ